jgi:molybdopterin converting factor small subunit
LPQIRVRYFGGLREIVGKKEEHVLMEDGSVMIDLVKKLSEINGKKFSEFIFDSEGKLKDGFAYAINGDSVSEARLRRTKCKEVSVFVILPPISGGETIC